MIPRAPDQVQRGTSRECVCEMAGAPPAIPCRGHPPVRHGRGSSRPPTGQEANRDPDLRRHGGWPGRAAAMTWTGVVWVRTIGVRGLGTAAAAVSDFEENDAENPTYVLAAACPGHPPASSKSRSRFEAAWWVAGTGRGHDVEWGDRGADNRGSGTGEAAADQKCESGQLPRKRRVEMSVRHGGQSGERGNLELLSRASERGDQTRFTATRCVLRDPIASPNHQPTHTPCPIPTRKTASFSAWS